MINLWINVQINRDHQQKMEWKGWMDVGRDGDVGREGLMDGQMDVEVFG